jgi:hypothetical protein
MEIYSRDEKPYAHRCRVGFVNDIMYEYVFDWSLPRIRK